MKCKACHFDVLIHDYYFIRISHVAVGDIAALDSWSTRINYARTKSRSSQDISDV